MTENAMVESSTGAVIEQPKAKPKGTGFAAMLAKLRGNAEAAAGTGGTGKKVKAATLKVVEAEIPELVLGLFDKDGKPHTNEAGVTASVFKDVKGIGGRKGAMYVCRPHVILTREIAKMIAEQYSGHNRNQTEPAIKRYVTAMDKPDASRSAWHFVGNTLGFVVKKVGDSHALGLCNGGHTCKALQRSTRKAIIVNAYFGIPEEYANLADVNIPRTAKDTIGRVHHYDHFMEADAEIEGEPLSVELKDSDIKTLDNTHSQVLRIIACIQAGKKVKDSEPLTTSDISDLDDKYKDIVVNSVIRTYLIDKMAMLPNDKGKPVPGGLKKMGITLSHAAALMAIATTEDNNGTLQSVDEAVEMVEKFFCRMVDLDLDDVSDPAVALRETLLAFKVDKMTDQNIRFAVEKTCLLAEFGRGDVDIDVDTLKATESDDTIPTFNTILDPEAEEEEDDVDELDDDGEELDEESENDGVEELPDDDSEEE